MGRIIIQQFVINSSNFKRFKVDRIKQINDNNNKIKEKINENRIITNSISAIIFAYSVNNINEKYIELYSVIKPATNSDSDSGKSKGTLFNSANIHIKLIITNIQLLNNKYTNIKTIVNRSINNNVIKYNILKIYKNK